MPRASLRIDTILANDQGFCAASVFGRRPARSVRDASVVKDVHDCGTRCWPSAVCTHYVPIYFISIHVKGFSSSRLVRARPVAITRQYYFDPNIVKLFYFFYLSKGTRRRTRIFEFNTLTLYYTGT